MDKEDGFVHSVLITRKIPESILRPYQENWNVTMWPHEEIAMDRNQLLDACADAEGIFTVLTDKIDREVLDKAKKVKIIANMAVGYDNIDIEYAKHRGIIVTNTPDILTETTADLTFGLLLAAARKIVQANQYIKDGLWKSWSPYFMTGVDVHHKTLGIVGMGRIGEAIAKRALGFNMNIIYHNRTRKEEAEEKLQAKYVSFHELIETADFIVCMTPLTESTREIFNRDVFRKMKQTAIFINTSRGGVVNEEDLYEALVNKEILAAGLDVFQKEPILPNHPLLQLDNVVALPHIGSATVETRTAMIELALKNIERVLLGKPPLTSIK
jgi:glyoxylate reductase